MKLFINKLYSVSNKWTYVQQFSLSIRIGICLGIIFVSTVGLTQNTEADEKKI